MTDNIVFFKARPIRDQTEKRTVWTCSDCSGQWFWLYRDGSVQCCQCDKEHVTIRTFLPEEKP